ncbi:MAG: CoA-binding protein [Bacteroidota bacterium]
MGFQKEEQQVISETDKTTVGKKTVIIGASDNPSRYAYLAAQRLTDKNHQIVPVGIRKGVVQGIEVLDLKTKPEIKDVDTVTMYINPTHQQEWESYILGLQPKRIIFNPGTENPTMAAKANKLGIETENACTLVMLSIGNY